MTISEVEKTMRLQTELRKGLDAMDARRVKEALRRGADPKMEGSSQGDALERVCRSRELESAKCLMALLERDGGEWARGHRSYPGLVVIAARSGPRASEKLRALAEAGVSMSQGIDGGLALHWLCAMGEATPETVRTLAGLGVDLNQEDDEARRPLDLAFTECSAETIVALYELGGRFDASYCEKWVGIRADEEISALFLAIFEREALRKAAGEPRRSSSTMGGAL